MIIYRVAPVFLLSLCFLLFPPLNLSQAADIIITTSVPGSVTGSDNSVNDSSGWTNSITITGTGSVADDVFGSNNSGVNSSGGDHFINNSGSVLGGVYGSNNSGVNSNGGSNYINNSGSVGYYIFGTGPVPGNVFGSNNSGVNSSGGNNYINNSGSVHGNIYGSNNTGDNSNGGSNSIINSGSVNFIWGSYNLGTDSSGGDNSIINSGSVMGIIGSVNSGSNSSGGDNYIINSGFVIDIRGSANSGSNSSGGDNYINNSGSGHLIYGSHNVGNNSSGGNNYINNSGSVNFIWGSLNYGTDSSGGDNYINNSGFVGGDIMGSYNSGSGSYSSGNTIENSGYVAGNIWGSRNLAGSTGGNDTIINSGTVIGSIYGNDGNDTIIIVGGSRLDGVADGGTGTDTLGFDNIGTIDGAVIGTDYLNFENLGIYGGENILIGNWDISGGNTTVFEGSMILNGTLSTRIFTIEAPGFLGGNGIINSNVINYGTISPGNSIGTLTVNGSVDFMPGSFYIVELDSNGDCDLLSVNGAVVISGGQLDARLPRALYTDGRQWRIIEASGGIDGKFTSINTNFNSETIKLYQSVGADSLSLVIKRTPYASFGQTTNQIAIGSTLDTLLPSASGSMANLMIAMDFEMNRTQISNTLQGLNPEMYTVFPAAGLESAHIIGQSISLHQQELRTLGAYPVEGETSPLWNVWARALGSKHERDPDNEMAGYELETGGAVFGIDRHFGTLLQAGMLLGYSDGDLSWDNPGNSGQITGKHIGLYGSATIGGFYLDGLATYNSLDNSSERLIETPLFSGISNSGFDADVFAGSVTSGYDFSFGPVRLGPVAAISYSSLDQDGFTENGATAFSVEIEGTDAESLTSRLGIRLDGLFTIGSWRFLPNGELGWLHQFEDDTPILTASFIDYPAAPFNVTGTEPISDQLVLSLGMVVENGSNLNFYAEYSLAASSEYQSQMLSCGLSWLF